MEDATSPYHAAEQALQTELGVRARAEQMGRKMIRDHLPEQHRDLLRTLPFVLIGSLDAKGRPWASLLAGKPGFASSPDPRRVTIAALPSHDDPLSAALAPGAPLGLLAIQLETRRRNRANGRVDAVRAGGFDLTVEQTFGNCPQYITPRAPLWLRAGAAEPRVTREGPRLNAAAVACIAESDTCFIASASSPTPTPGVPHDGVDVSHRGGAPGFVSVAEDDSVSTLTLPDYAGNNAFNTLGNLRAYPRAGLLFPRFSTGDLLLVTGSAELVTGAPQHLQDTGRHTLFRVDEGIVLHGALPFRWSHSPH